MAYSNAMLDDLIDLVLVQGRPLKEAGDKYSLYPQKVQSLLNCECRQRNYHAWKQSQANYDGIKGLRRLADRFIEKENA